MGIKPRNGLLTGGSFTLLAQSFSSIIEERNGDWHTTHL
jgi:hypothetical protein